MGTIIIFGVPLIVWLGCCIAAYYRVTNYNPKTKHPVLRFLAYVLHFMIVMLSGVILYQAVLDYLNLSEHLAVMIGMGISLVSEGIAKAVIKISNDYSIIKNWILEMVKRIFGF